jgi:hypothetical protein
MEEDCEIIYLKSELNLVQKKIDSLIKNNPISLDFSKKSWAACPEGQELLSLTNKSEQIKKEIYEKNKQKNL